MIRTTTISEENLQFIFKDIGGRLLNYYTTKERLEGLTPETVLKNFTPAEEKQLFERLAKKYGVAQNNGA